jgi:hypothetical protein
MTEITNQLAKSKNNKNKIIDALLHRNLFKMPDGRQFYEASEKELIDVLYSCSDSKNVILS